MKEKFSKDSSYLLIAEQNGKVDNVTKEEYFQRSKNIPQNNDKWNNLYIWQCGY